MNKVAKVLVLALMLFGVVACGSDDNNGEYHNEYIITSKGTEFKIESDNVIRITNRIINDEYGELTIHYNDYSKNVKIFDETENLIIFMNELIENFDNAVHMHLYKTIYQDEHYQKEIKYLNFVNLSNIIDVELELKDETDNYDSDKIMLTYEDDEELTTLSFTNEDEAIASYIYIKDYIHGELN